MLQNRQVKLGGSEDLYCRWQYSTAMQIIGLLDGGFWLALQPLLDLRDCEDLLGVALDGGESVQGLRVFLLQPTHHQSQHEVRPRHLRKTSGR